MTVMPGTINVSVSTKRCLAPTLNVCCNQCLIQACSRGGIAPLEIRNSPPEICPETELNYSILVKLLI